MNPERHDAERTISEIGAAISEPARVRILYSLLDGRARTSTELAMVAEVSPSTTSAHLKRLHRQKLITGIAQGKHRYYRLYSPDVADALEALNLIASSSRDEFLPNTPGDLMLARTCYDHIAGRLGVALYNNFADREWFCIRSVRNGSACDLSAQGRNGFASLGIDLEETSRLRRRFAYECLDWSERRPHLGGALAASLLRVMLEKNWVEKELDSRALTITDYGRRELRRRLNIQL
ncbi:MAG TPA: metalloregulator ArsR/SmtB family transcription factor [Pyrinomonadaceae bacterium]|nr:metalloregulator ArsR/SmtB family transcription factor [Pyrinomonadaceae bacterium]